MYGGMNQNNKRANFDLLLLNALFACNNKRSKLEYVNVVCMWVCVCVCVCEYKNQVMFLDHCLS